MGKVSPGSAGTAPAHQTKRRSFNRNPGNFQAIQSRVPYLVLDHRVCDGGEHPWLPVKAELLLVETVSAWGWGRGGWMEGCLSLHPTQRMDTRPSARNRGVGHHGEAASMTTETKPRLAARLREPTTGEGTSFGPGSFALVTTRDVTAFVTHAQAAGKDSRTSLTVKALLTNFIPDVRKFDRQLFFFLKGTFALQKTKRIPRVP